MKSQKQKIVCKPNHEQSTLVATSVSYFIPFSPFLLVLCVVVPGRPAGVLLHVHLPLHPRHLVVLGLVLPREGVPLEREK